MLELPWDSHITSDSLRLADAIELLVALDDSQYGERFTRADFQHWVDMENLDVDGRSYLDESQAYEMNATFDEAVGLIEKRALWLADAYPFVVNKDEVQFKIKSTLRNHLIYLFLLICSNRNFVPNIGKGLPVQFEDLCKEALRALFPDWSEVLSFRKNSRDRSTVFGYAADIAVPRLAKKLNAELKNENRLGKGPREFGIDVLAISSFDDLTPYPFFAFAQCTVQLDWWEKRHEALARSELNAFVPLDVDHSNFLMIPHFPRLNFDEWSEDPGKTINCILCDRLRICTLLLKSGRFECTEMPEGLSAIFDKLENRIVTLRECG